jgi:hypothetical protein
MCTRYGFSASLSSTARMDSNTLSGVFLRLHTGSLQAEFFWFAAVTQGEQDNSAVMDSVFPRLP